MAFQPRAMKHCMIEGDGLAAAGSRVPAVDSDLCCMEDGGGWDKDSPGATAFHPLPREGVAGRAAAVKTFSGSENSRGTRLPTLCQRVQLRRSRVVDSGVVHSTSTGIGSRPFVRRPSGPPAERVDCLLNMFRAQKRFSPAGVTGMPGTRALCRSVSPFVAERRGLFVAWKVRE